MTLQASLTTTSADETRALGKSLTKKLRGGDVVALHGDLGSGKTTLVQGIAAGLGVRRTVNSPTFILMRVYPVRPARRGIKQLVHVDGYRIHDTREFDGIGLADYLGQPNTITLIEWPKETLAQLPHATWQVTLTAGTQPNERRIQVTPPPKNRL